MFEPKRKMDSTERAEDDVIVGECPVMILPSQAGHMDLSRTSLDSIGRAEDGGIVGQCPVMILPSQAGYMHLSRTSLDSIGRAEDDVIVGECPVMILPSQAGHMHLSRTSLMVAPGEIRRSSEGVDVKVLTPQCQPEESRSSVSYHSKAPPHNVYIKAHGHVQRVIDVALLISNMSRMATIIHRSDSYTPMQVQCLLVALTLSMVAQVVAGICFFIAHQKEINGAESGKYVDYTAYACVGAVMLLNIFISTFDASWSAEVNPTNRSALNFA